MVVLLDELLDEMMESRVVLVRYMVLEENYAAEIMLRCWRCGREGSVTE